MDRLIALIYEDNYEILLDEESVFAQCYESLAGRTGATLNDLRICINDLLQEFEKQTTELLDRNYLPQDEEELDNQINIIKAKRNGLLRTLGHLDTYELSQVTTRLRAI